MDDLPLGDQQSFAVSSGRPQIAAVLARWLNSQDVDNEVILEMVGAVKGAPLLPVGGTYVPARLPNVLPTATRPAHRTVSTGTGNRIALHAAGVTDGRDCYPVRAGMYLEPGAESDSWVLVEKPLGDILHVGFPPIEGALTPELERAIAALQVLDENLDAGVRGDLEVTLEMKEAYFAAYGKCLKQCRAIVVAHAQVEEL